MFSSTKTANVFASKKDSILSAFTKTADELVKLNAEIERYESEQELKIAKAQTEIDAANAEKKQAANIKAQNKAVADKILAIVS